MFISELLTFINNIDRQALNGISTLTNKQIKSISAYSSKAIYYFPTIVSDGCTPEEITLISRGLERQYGAFVVTCIGLIPFHRIPQGSQGSIEEYLRIFHQNIGINAPTNFNLLESAIRDQYFESYNMDIAEVQFISEAYESLNEKFEKDCLDRYTRYLYEKSTLNEARAIPFDINNANDNPANDITTKVKLSSSGSIEAFDGQKIFMDTDAKKANEMVPSLTKVSIGFIIDETEEVIQRDVVIGIKVYVRSIGARELCADIYNNIINKRKFLKFLKFTSGEERSLSDLFFGVKELKKDAISTKDKKNSWIQAFKRRQRWAKMTIPFIMKSYTPNGTVVITMNDVEHIKDKYGIDLMDDSHVEMIIKSNFLLGFVVLDQANETVYIAYDSHTYGFQTYTYAALERETSMNDRMMRDLYRTMNSR